MYVAMCIHKCRKKQGHNEAYLDTILEVIQELLVDTNMVGRGLMRNRILV